MHNQDYIASGVLELYAAGGLTQAEREEVERRAAASPDIRLALDEACAAMEAYAALYAAQPRPELKGRVMQEIENHGFEERALPAEEPIVQPLYPVDSEASSAYRWMFAASIVLLLLSGALSFHFYTKWQHAEERLAGVIASEQLLAQNIRNTSLQLQKQAETLSILRNPEFKPVRLQGVEAHPEASMLVYWNPSRQQVYVDAVTLPAPPAGKQYQLWALKDGEPVDAGLIQAPGGRMSLQQMKSVSSAQAFAVTLEPAGGSEVPTLEQLTVMGNVES
ncbi:anti-sigma factor [Pontibacter pamirensis]|uniref:anti-sigma factor n=1 Tax=Pontibacter pamirensis TaxID=2562824 RepID=UPI001389C311|nr:anti-sigma factor [Pontibacter pamirensis]